MKKKRMSTNLKTKPPVSYDTKMGALEKKLNVTFNNVRSDMKLGNFLKREGYPSLSRMLRST